MYTCVYVCVCLFVYKHGRTDGRIRFQLLVGAAPADYLSTRAGALRAGKLLPVWPENYVPAELAASYADSPAR